MESQASALFERYHLAICRFFRRLTGSRDLAEDLTQEVFVRVVKGLRDYRADGREAGWVFQIARHVLADHYRRRPEPPVSLADPEAATASGAAGQLLAFGLQQALDRLPDPERTAFLLVEVAGLSYREAGDVCETSDDGIGSRLFRARRQLRALLSDRLDLDARRPFKRV
jgi:RNA polymerase sigma factor (sigma-70 family)